MAVITISRHFGAGGHTLGEKLCERFNFRLTDASVIDDLADKAKLSPNWLSAMEKEASSTILSMISTLVEQLVQLRGQGCEVVLVSSGAVAAGASQFASVLQMAHVNCPLRRRR